MEFGDRLKKLRKTQNSTQKELAKKVNVSPQVISNWERGYTDIDRDDLIRLANAFGVTTDDLLNRTPQTFKPLEKELNQAVVDGMKVEDIRKKFNLDITTLTDEELKKITNYVQVSRSLLGE